MLNKSISLYENGFKSINVFSFMFLKPSTLTVSQVTQKREDFVMEYEGVIQIDATSYGSRIAFALYPPHPLEFRIFFVDTSFLHFYQDLKNICNITYCNLDSYRNLSRVLSHADLADLYLATFTAFENSYKYGRETEFEVRRKHKKILKELLAEAFTLSVHEYGVFQSAFHKKQMRLKP